MDESLPIFLPDGIYRLAETVSSPLPRRLTQGRRSKGWALRRNWSEGQRFKVESNQIKPVRFCDRAGRLGPKQIRAVTDALARQLRIVPALPSDITDGYDADEILDALCTLGRITLDDVRQADLTIRATGALGKLSELYQEPTEEPAAAQAPSAPGPVLRVGDAILDERGVPSNIYVVVRVWAPGEYVWQEAAAGAEEFTQPWYSFREPVIGHVADAIENGLRTISEAPEPDIVYWGAIADDLAEQADPFRLD